MTVKELDQEYIAHTYNRFPVQIVSGKGSLLTDETGKQYIDLGAGIAVSSFGTADDQWVAAVTAQLGKVQHTSNLFYSEPCVRLAELLCKRTGMKKVFFSNSGAEANECAIKAARKYAADKKGPGCHTIITLKNSFHGRTLTTLAATGQDAFHKDFLPLTEGFVCAEPENLDSVEKLVRDYSVAGILFEAVQGEGGVVPLSKGFVQGLAKIAKREDILLMADEVQIGNGRSGRLYGYMNDDIVPDVVTTAKGLAGGLPLGATLLGEKAENVFTPGLNGSTFGGNPAVCAGALSILSRIDDGLLAEVREKSAMVFRELSGAKGVKSVTGMGLMIGVEPEKPLADVVAACREKGVLVLTAKTKVRLLPPLNIPAALLKQGVDVLKSVLAE